MRWHEQLSGKTSLRLAKILLLNSIPFFKKNKKIKIPNLISINETMSHTHSKDQTIPFVPQIFSWHLLPI